MFFITYLGIVDIVWKYCVPNKEENCCYRYQSQESNMKQLRVQIRVVGLIPISKYLVPPRYIVNGVGTFHVGISLRAHTLGLGHCSGYSDFRRLRVSRKRNLGPQGYFPPLIDLVQSALIRSAAFSATT